MPRLARFLCPSCGKQLTGDAANPSRRPTCDCCARSGRLWEKVDSVRAPVAAPPVPPPLPAPSNPATRKRLFVAVGALIGVLFVVVGIWRFETSRRAEDHKARTAAANQV